MSKDKFQNKYRIPSSRLQNWDYGSAAMYFITICTRNRQCFFGNVIDHKMQLSDIGEIVELEWLQTFELRPDMNLDMGVFVVMPNHFHAIIGIGENQYNMERGVQRGARCGTHRRDAMHCVSTRDTRDTQNTPGKTNPKNPNKPPIPPKNKFGPQSKNLASIIRGFKSAVTVGARKIHPGFQWQSRFHDHIIRNDDSLQRITKYIINNPGNWKDDSFYSTE